MLSESACETSLPSPRKSIWHKWKCAKWEFLGAHRLHGWWPECPFGTNRNVPNGTNIIKVFALPGALGFLWTSYGLPMGFLCFVSSGSGPSHFRSQIHQPETLSDLINFVSFGHLFCLDLDLAILLHQDVHVAQTELYQMNFLDGIPNRPSGELGRPARQQPASQYPWGRPDAHSGVRHRTTPPTSPSELLGASPSRNCQVAYTVV